jgi:preprotein translocase subunit SecF
MSNTKSTFNSGKYDFLGKAKYLVPFTLIITILGAFQIFFSGFDYSIDFVGGTEIQLRFGEKIEASELRNVVSDLGFDNASVQSFGENNEFLIRVESIHGKDDEETNKLQNEVVNKLTAGLNTKFAGRNAEIRRVDSVGPQVGSELKRSGILATIYSLLIVLIYIALRFDYKYAPAAVLCTIHDVVMTLAIFALFDIEVSLQTMAAILTLIGYSLNDTIITFDRIRENEKIFRDVPFEKVVNRSINDMLMRTILTTSTTFISVLALYFFSDGVIQHIAFTLGIGIIIGTVSSIYIASPIVIIFDRMLAKKAAKRLQTARV